MTRHHASIGGAELESDSDFIVYGPCSGLAAECGNLADARCALERKLAEVKQFNAPCDLTVFRWSDGNWTPALSPYEIQEWEIQRDPSRVIVHP
jgi:hypothetical protein